MQFTDLILKFLDRLGYSEQSVILTTVTEESSEDSDSYENESAAVLVLGKNEERVIGVFLLADEADRRSTVSKSSDLQSYAKKFDRDVGRYIISHATQAESNQVPIEFYKCELNGQCSQIDISDFPSYSEMWVLNSQGASKRKSVSKDKRNSQLISYAYFFSVIFLILAVGDIFVEKLLDVSYLNTQRALLIVVSVLLLFVPGLLKNRRYG